MSSRKKLILNILLFVSCIALAGGAVLYNYGYKLCWKCSTHDYYKRGKEFVSHGDDELRKTGVDFLRHAADHEDTAAQLLLAEGYQPTLPDGYVSQTATARNALSTLLPKNPVAAKRLFNTAYNRLYSDKTITAEQLYNMAILVENGIINRDDAQQLLIDAAEAGNYIAMSRLGRILHRQANYEQAKKWLRLVAEAGKDAQPALILGDYFFYGKSEAINYEKAIHWYRIALKTQKTLTARASEKQRLAAEDAPMARIEMAMRQLQKNRMQAPMTLRYHIGGNARRYLVHTEDHPEGTIGTVSQENDLIVAEIDPSITLALSIPVAKKTFSSMNEGMEWVLQSYARSRYGSYTKFHFELIR
ncbi:MAG: sel1 repeat family protein [Desulfuromonas sp.]|nr:sel1 repeat family protein [Desulfuromonas sp.]